MEREDEKKNKADVCLNWLASFNICLWNKNIKTGATQKM